MPDVPWLSTTTGFDTTATSGGVGLASIRTRAVAQGADAQIDGVHNDQGQMLRGMPRVV